MEFLSMYKLLFSLKQNGVYTFKWLNFIESIFNDTGMGYVFANQDDSDNRLYHGIEEF
jgi:hypothetical protein